MLQHEQKDSLEELRHAELWHTEEQSSEIFDYCHISLAIY